MTPPRNSCRLKIHHSHQKKREAYASAAAERPAARTARLGSGSPRPYNHHGFQNSRLCLLLRWSRRHAQFTPPLSKEYYLHMYQGKASPNHRVQHPTLLLRAAQASAPPLDARVVFLAPLLPPSLLARHRRNRRWRRCRPSRQQQPRLSSTLRLLKGKRRSSPCPHVDLLLRFMPPRASFRPVGPRPQQTPLTALLLLRHAAPPRHPPPRAQCRRQHSPRSPVSARQSRGGVDRLLLTR